MGPSAPTADRALLCQPKPDLQLLGDALWGELGRSDSGLAQGRHVQSNMQTSMLRTQLGALLPGALGGG